MRDMMSLVHPGEDWEKMSVEGRRIRYSRIAQQYGEQGRERDDQDQHGSDLRNSRIIEVLEVLTDDELRPGNLLPGQGAQNCGLHPQVQDGNAGDGNENSPGNILFRVPDLSAEMAYVVISKVRIDRLLGGLPHRNGKQQRQLDVSCMKPEG